MQDSGEASEPEDDDMDDKSSSHSDSSEEDEADHETDGTFSDLFSGVFMYLLVFIFGNDGSCYMNGDMKQSLMACKLTEPSVLVRKIKGYGY